MEKPWLSAAKIHHHLSEWLSPAINLSADKNMLRAFMVGLHKLNTNQWYFNIF